MSKFKKLSPLLLLVLAIAGCTPKDPEPDPSTIPNIPPSTRGAGGGGPGAEGGGEGVVARPTSWNHQVSN